MHTDPLAEAEADLEAEAEEALVVAVAETAVVEAGPIPEAAAVPGGKTLTFQPRCTN